MPGNPDKVKLGPGWLYVADEGATLPTNLATPLATVDSDYALVGYTDAGSTVTFDNGFEDVEVAEELEAIDSVQTSRMTKVSFAAAEMTAENLDRAFNGGTITTGSGYKKYVPPSIGQVTYRTLIWQSASGDERWVFKKVVQQGSIEIARQKAPAKATIAMEYRALVPDDASQPWEAYIAD